MIKKTKKLFKIEIEPITSILLILATIIALYICNSPYKYLYDNFFITLI